MIKDLYSGLKDAYIMPDRSGESAMEASRRFSGGQLIRRVLLG